MTGHRYWAHGYVVDSELELPALPVLDDAASNRADVAAWPQLTLRRGEARPIPAEAPPGAELAYLDDPNRRVLYGFSRDSAGVTLRYPGACEFRADHRLTEVTSHLAPDGDEALAAVLAAGSLLATRLVLDGELTLHASAVAVDGAAVAFVGASGMGKSTLAALCCAAGAELLTDDVLRVSDPAGSATVWPGAVECRLREGSRSLADGTSESAPRRTGDGRTALRPARLSTESLPLAACIIPFLTREPVSLKVARLGEQEALLALCTLPRLVGWREPTALSRQFELAAELVRRVPILVARVPWGPPFDPAIASGLLDGALTERRVA